MPAWVTPARRRGVEILDDPGTPSDVRQHAMADLERSNGWFGGTRSVRRALRDVLPRLGQAPVLLDVGTGTGDIPAVAARDARDARIALVTLGVDVAEDLARLARRRLSGVFVGSALDLPLADASVDVVTCSQVLHHFANDDARRLVAELHRVSRGWVVISDLRRSWLAAGGFWIASTLLRFHAVTRADGVTSVLRGFTAPELAALVRDVTGVTPRVRRGVFWRLSANWETDPRRSRDAQ